MSELILHVIPDILAYSHGCNDLLHSLFSFLLLLIVQFCLQFKDLPWKKKSPVMLGVDTMPVYKNKCGQKA